jgi:hypothetical protein
MGRRRHESEAWELIQRSLEGYQPERLGAALREYLTPRVPQGERKLDESLRSQLRQGVEAILREHVGPWYGRSGFGIDTQILSCWCWCHSFFNQKPFAELSVEHNVQLMLQGLARGHAWMTKLDELYRSVELLDDEDPDIRRMALSDAVVKAIEVTAEATGTEDAWYSYAEHAVEWLFEATGTRITSKVRSAMNQTVGMFESWIGPTPEETRAVGDALALAAVQPDFDARYPREE